MLWRAVATVLFSVPFADVRQQTSFPVPLRAASQCRRFDVVIVDVENVRGRSGFSWTHADLLKSLSIWNLEACLFGKLVLSIDHGYEAASYWIPDKGYAIVFAGPHCKADDTIARELVPFFSTANATNILVVTADQELIQRCKRAGTSKLQILSPDSLLSDLDRIRDLLPPPAVDATNTEDAPDAPSGLTNSYELKLGGDLLEIEALLKARAAMSSSRRKKLRLKGQALWQKLQSTSPRMLERVVEFMKLGRTCASVTELSRPEQAALLNKWDKERVNKRRKEKTEDRVFLAENLRLEVEDAYSAAQVLHEGKKDDDSTSVHTALSYVLHSTRRTKTESFGLDTLYSEIEGSIKTTGVLRLVVVSDTHGFESQLAKDEVLPEGDVLLHLGDFADDRGPNEADSLKQFDAWLARQPHPCKIVLRGNHDPRCYEFVQSRATYITQATTRHIAGYKFAFAPYLSGGLRRKKCLPKSCDVLVSHVPPRNILDRCVTGKFAGSQTLLKGAQQMTGGPPILWLCGHIHEGRGVLRNTVLCMNKKTTIVNAASANSGTAARLEYGPVVVHLGQDDRDEGNTKQKNTIEIVRMDGQYVFMNDRYPAFFRKRSNDYRQMLLSVDLGLRTGISLFDDTGLLLRYENFQFESVDELRISATRIVEEWGTNVFNDSSAPTRVTHIAVEGGDPPLADAWRQAAGSERSLLFVKPDDWRGDLLTIEEMMTGESSKAASRLIAQQIVSDYGVAKDAAAKTGEEFQTDMAESILLGLHMARRLGWVQSRDPAIRRASNGKVDPHEYRY